MGEARGVNANDDEEKTDRQKKRRATAVTGAAKSDQTSWPGKPSPVDFQEGVRTRAAQVPGVESTGATSRKGEWRKGWVHVVSLMVLGDWFDWPPTCIHDWSLFEVAKDEDGVNGLVVAVADKMIYMSSSDT